MAACPFPGLGGCALNSELNSQLADPTKICQKFKCLGISLPITQNCMHAEIKIRIKSRNVFYNSVQKLSSSRLLNKNRRIKIDRTINFACCFVWAWNLVSHIEG